MTNSNTNTPAVAERSVYLGLGSNQGKTYANIVGAITALRTIGYVSATSSLYQSNPAYVTNQPKFLNAAIRLETKLEPLEILRFAKGLEKEYGRTPTIRNGPRPLDIDILLDGDNTVREKGLTVPHPSMSERDFVLKPLMDLDPLLRHPHTGASVTDMYNGLSHKFGLERVLPINFKTFLPIGARTLIMGILNVTPDSFSDGGEYTDVNAALRMAEKMLNHGADIVDIGGQSTRPGAEPISPDQERKRVLPVVEAISSHFPDAIMSVDTFHSSVANDALLRGAVAVNDVASGTRDGDMFRVVEKHHAPIFMMHMRGTPETMSQHTNYDNLVQDVALEMKARVDAARAHRILDWNIIVDPGIGFAKNTDQNVELLRRLDEWKAMVGSYSVLVGASRKRFIGEICNVPHAADRDVATTVTTCAAIAGGADVVRVHNVEMASDAVKMADAIWRK